MKLWKVSTFITLACLVPCLCFSGCGSSSAVTTSITLSSSEEGTLILGQSTTITAAVVGPADMNVTWGGGPNNTAACTYTTTTYNSSGTPTTATAKPCPAAPSGALTGVLGSLSNEQVTGSATFLAPSTLPSPTTYPGLIIIITACTAATPVKCNTVDLTIDSGISVQLDPVTAAVPTNEKQPFFAILTNDLKTAGVTWLLTQQTPTGTTTNTNTNEYATLTTCTVAGNASGCGSIDTNGVYTAPSAVPTATTPAYTSTAPTDCTTPQNVTVVATSVTDPTRFAIGTITITQGGPITFNGIAPTIAPQGAAYWDIYLNAPNISSASQITLTDSLGGVTPLNSVEGQVKVLFPIPVSSSTTTTGSGVCAITTSTITQSSSGARIRLLANNLATAGPVTVSVTDPGEPVTQSTGGAFTYNILPVRPTAVYSSPNDVIQNTVAQANPSINLTIDGGYFGTNGSLANVLFPTTNTPLPGVTNGEGQPLSYAKQLSVQLPASDINSGLPGLYSLSVSRTTLPLPSINNSAVTDLAVFPSYATNPPMVINSLSTGAKTNPSAVDIDPGLGVLVVAETSANAVQFYSIGKGTLTPIGGAVPVGMLPTGLSVNRTNHTVAVVNYGDQTVWVLPIPGAPVVPGTPFSFSMAGVLQGAVTPAPLPYSIGVDPDTNMGIVAYSSTSTSSFANLGFLVNLNTGTNPYGCLNGQGTAPCVYAQVTLDTGAYPQIAMAPHGHLAFVSPGGSGVLRGVDVTKPSTEAWISQLTLAAGIVTATTTGSTGLVPGNSGAVLITGVPATNAAGNAQFNGVYTVTAISDNSFTYLITSTESGTVTIPLLPNSTTQTSAPMYYSTPNLTFGGISQTTQGIAINPITNTAALADADAVSNSQIYLINDLDQSLGQISFSNMCTAYNLTCPGGSELLGTADVAWQPYTNLLVSYNPGNPRSPQTPVNQVSISDPVSSTRQAFVCELGNATNMKTGTGSACVVQPNPSVGQPPCAAPNNTPTACTQQFLNQITLQGTGATSLMVNNGSNGLLDLFGGLAVDPATNQAFVVMSGSNQIDIVDLGPCSAANNCVNPYNSLKPAQITEILVPSPNPGLGIIGGIPGASVPQGTLTSANDLTGVQIFGSGFDSSTFLRLDGAPVQPGPKTVGPLVQFVSSRQINVTIPSTYLSFPHRFALDVVTPDAPGGSSTSNATDFFVVQAVDMTPACAPVPTNGPMPSSVAIADQLANGAFAPIAVVSNSNCNNISVIDMNPADVTNGTGPNPGRFGTILNSVAVGMTPEGVAISQPLGLALVANNGAGTVSTVNLLTGTEMVPDVGTGTNPTGIAIDDATGAALVTNTGSNTVTELNLLSLFGTSAVTALVPVSIGGFQQPTAVAIDPDRGTNNQGLAIVTTLELQTNSFPLGGLAPVDIGLPIPMLSTIATTGTVTAPTTGIVFDPTVITGTANPGVFYASSSGGNVISSFNPDSGSVLSINVGINPTALAINPQSGAILTTNVAGNTISLVDTTSSPLRTVKTIGLPGSPQFAVAVDQFTNLAVIVDQGNNRLLIFSMPN